MSEYMRAMREKVGSDMLMVCGASGVVINEQGEVLLQLRSDFGIWALPGGALDPGEQPADAAVREIFEETGVRVVPEKLIGVYGGTDQLFTYPDGNQVAITSIVFRCRPISGEPVIHDDESLDVQYFPIDQLPDSLRPDHRLRIQHALSDEPASFFQQP
jgi:ADP-ribose pyrophosphatase YjhB (NUDIX family)